MVTSGLLILATATLVLAAPIEQPVRRGNLPMPVDVATAKSYLNDIAVAEPSNSPAYERRYFHTWDTIEGNCNAREYVLKRDGSNVVVNNACTATSGTWFSDYDGVTWTSETKLQIDHLVPLKEAWESGAKDWTASQREAFANDVTRPQLIAVTGSVNESKGDRDIANWLPSREAFVCEYVRAWITVKHYYKLNMDSAEKQAALNVLNNKC